METGSGNSFFYPVFKMILGVLCLVLGIEYGYSYCVYEAASFGIIYIGDMVTWLLAGFILFTEGLYIYLQLLREPKYKNSGPREKEPITVYAD